MSVNIWCIEELILMAFKHIKGCSSSLIRGIKNKRVMIIPTYYVDKDIESRHIYNMVEYNLLQPLWMNYIYTLSKS